MDNAALFNLLRTEPLRKLTSSLWYPGFQPGLPDILVLKLPPALCFGRTALNSRLKLVFVENYDERIWTTNCLKRPLDIEGTTVNFTVGIDKVNLKPSTLPASRDMGILLYVPPELDWPHIVVTMMNHNIPDQDLGRQRYAWDAFENEESAMAHMTWMSSTALPPGVTIEIRGPDTFKKD